MARLNETETNHQRGRICRGDSPPASAFQTHPRNGPCRLGPRNYQAEIAKKYDRTKGSVSQASKIVWRGFLKSKGYEEVRVVLPQVRAFIANGWHQDALHELNYGTKRPERKVRWPPRPPRKAKRQSDE